jgi:signal transduction histidine kinase
MARTGGFTCSASLLRDSEGRVTRWYGLLIDIDDRKSMEEALRSTQTRLSRATQTATVGELSASIAHEINQPLAAVVTNGHACLRWLTAEPPNLGKAREAAERIVRDGKEAGEVVRRIRALFRRAALEKVALDLNEVIGEVLRLLGGNHEKARHRGDRPRNRAATRGGDRVQLQQLVLNLLINGLDAMDEVSDRPRKLCIRSRQHLRGHRARRDTGFRRRVEGSGQDIRGVLHHERERHGHGFDHLPLDRRSARRPSLGLTGEGPGTIFRFTLPS